MKRRFIFFLGIIVVFVFGIGGCTESNIKESAAPQVPIEGRGGIEDIQKERESSEEQFPIIENDFYALELLGGYRIDENGCLYINSRWENNCDTNIFREYFFGTWGEGLDEDEKITIDDSEKSNINSAENIWLFNTLHVYNDTIIITCVNSIDTCIYWINKYKPNILYMQAGGTFPNDELLIFNINNDKGTKYKTKIIKKIDTVINEPEDNFLSKLKLFELEKEYNIKTSLFHEIDYILDGYYFMLYNQPIYLVLKAPDKLVLKTKLVYGYGFAFIDITYTIEIVGGEYLQTRTITPRAIEQAREQLKTGGYLLD